MDVFLIVFQAGDELELPLSVCQCVKTLYSFNERNDDDVIRISTYSLQRASKSVRLVGEWREKCANE